MMCNSCLVAVAAILVAAIALFLLAFQIVRMVVGILLLVALVGVTVLAAYVNEGADIGVALGLLLGFFLGPVRLSGVDFRQWFMDPSTPSESGDDSFIGLIRLGFHALWVTALAAIVGLVCTVSLWMPQTCRLHDPAQIWQPYRGSIYLDGVADWLIDLVSACAGIYADIDVVLGTLIGVLIGPALAELLWHRGLSRAQPPTAAREYLAPQGLPHVRKKAAVRGHRRLIICCDGTWNWPESRRETNVVRMVRALKPDDNGTAQIIHYHEGVGTGNFIDRLVGGGAGVGLSASVKACYGFLVDNYQVGDEIFLFGFSRGAFVVRSLAGVIGEVGMMRKDEMRSFADVWKWYCLGKDARRKRMGDLTALAPNRMHPVDIECVGVWDTVGALGIPGTRFCAKTYAFHDTSLGAHIRHAFQALAIDERRGNFQGAVWVPFDRTRRRRGAAPEQVQEHELMPKHDGPEQVQVQVLKQVWFPGVHSNVGGGYPQHGMSDTTFIWMIDQLRGLLGFDEGNIANSLDNIRNERYPGGGLEDSRTLFWKLVACPVPRPVGIISATEHVHQSAWDRSKADLPANDLYKSVGRLDWLAATIGLRVDRSKDEQEMADLPRSADPPELDIRPPLGLCGYLLQFVNPKG